MAARRDKLFEPGRRNPQTAPAKPEAQRYDLNNVLLWLLCGYVLLIAISDIILHWHGSASASRELKADSGRFMVINALTLTGFQSVNGTDIYPLWGHVYLLLLTLAGTFFVTVASSLCVVRIMRLRFSDKQVVRGGLITTVAMAVVGALPLIPAHGILNALMLSASAFGNSGLYFGKLPSLLNWQIQLIVLPLAVLGGLGLPVLMELFDWIRRRQPISDYSRRIVRLTAGFYLVAFVLFLIVQGASTNENLDTGESAARLFGSSSVTAINSRTLGLPYAAGNAYGTREFAREFPPAMLWLLIPFMIIGASPAGTAGGLKITTVAELFGGTRRALRGENPGRPFGIAVAWLGLYLLMLTLFFLMLLSTEGNLPPERILFETTSALSNVGLSYDQINVHTPALDIMSVTMFFGRIAPVLILWWMARTTNDAQLPVG